jgi:hypothetical protein
MFCSSAYQLNVSWSFKMQCQRIASREDLLMCQFEEGVLPWPKDPAALCTPAPNLQLDAAKSSGVSMKFKVDKRVAQCFLGCQDRVRYQC